MPLGRLVVAAKENTPSINPRKTLMNIIDAEKQEAKQEEQDTWMQCRHLKDANGKAMCMQYMSNCAKENCKQRYRESDFFSYRKYLKKDVKKAFPVKPEAPKGE